MVFSEKLRVGLEALVVSVICFHRTLLGLLGDFPRFSSGGSSVKPWPELFTPERHTVEHC